MTADFEKQATDRTYTTAGTTPVQTVLLDAGRMKGVCCAERKKQKALRAMWFIRGNE